MHYIQNYISPLSTIAVIPHPTPPPSPSPSTHLAKTPISNSDVNLSAVPQPHVQIPLSLYHPKPNYLALTEEGSLMTEAVRPAALLPLPEVYTPIGDTFSTNLSSWLLAVPGSPSSRTLMSPLRVRPSGRRLREPPNKRQAIDFLMSVYTQHQ